MKKRIRKYNPTPGNRKAQNRRSRELQKIREARGIPGCPQLPDDIVNLGRGLEPDEEQERTSALVIEAATWAIRAFKQQSDLYIREDQRRPVELREYVVDVGRVRLVEIGV